MKEEAIKLQNRCSCFDNLGEERPYAVVLDLYNEEGNYQEQGTDWHYFETEEQVDKFIKEYNQPRMGVRIIINK